MNHAGSSGPGASTSAVPVYLVRHAKAGSRGRWKGDDRLRPLSEAGRRQAEALSDRLAADRPARVLSSPYTRCVETLAPLAHKLGLEVEELDALAEGSSWPGALAIVLATDAPLVLCSHGDVVGGLVAGVAERQGIELDVADLPLAKGSAWVLGVRDGEVTSVHYEPPPD